tara:strand:+ start:262 stop:453 length:192 start_codon:yes stop_codon:yes gene_type:complete
MTKKITLTVSNISSKQWSSLVLELNLMRKAWARFGPVIKLSTFSLNKIVRAGTITKQWGENND